MQSFLFCRWDEFVGRAFLAKTSETGDKNRGDFHYMQMTCVMSKRYIFGDELTEMTRVSLAMM